MDYSEEMVKRVKKLQEEKEAGCEEEEKEIERVLEVIKDIFSKVVPSNEKLEYSVFREDNNIWIKTSLKGYVQGETSFVKITVTRLEEGFFTYTAYSRKMAMDCCSGYDSDLYNYIMDTFAAVSKLKE